MTNIESVCKKAKENVNSIAFASQRDMNEMLSCAASALVENAQQIIKANGVDIEVAKNAGKPNSFIDRLELNEKRIKDIADGIIKLTSIKCPVGEVVESWETDTGLNIKKVRVPLGVISIIYEARPNVTADAIALAIKSGNAVVLRGSKDAINSNKEITNCIKNAISSLGFNSEFIQLIEDTTREGATELMGMNKYIDALIPRGGAGLIANAVQNSKIPVIETGTGNCHLYVDDNANAETAVEILLNGKTQRISVCNALESLLVAESIAKRFLPKAVSALKEKGVKIVGCEKSRAISNEIELAGEEDYFTEYLDYKISCKIVSGVDEAIAHINKCSTHHSDAIVSKSKGNIEKFLKMVDSACVYANASTRFTDGFEFGFGAEMGISTQKLHARGPMGLKELTSYKYQIEGNGQVRK